MSIEITKKIIVKINNIQLFIEHVFLNNPNEINFIAYDESGQYYIGTKKLPGGYSDKGIHEWINSKDTFRNAILKKATKEEIDEIYKATALLKFLEPLSLYLEDIKKEPYTHYGLDVFEVNDTLYAIGTDEEADSAVKGYIRESLWAFNAWFIVEHTNLPYDAIELVEMYQKTKCEDANELIYKLIGEDEGLDEFVEDAIDADGRGHFLASYDGFEQEVSVNNKKYYIYTI